MKPLITLILALTLCPVIYSQETSKTLTGLNKIAIVTCVLDRVPACLPKTPAAYYLQRLILKKLMGKIVFVEPENAQLILTFSMREEQVGVIAFHSEYSTVATPTYHYIGTGSIFFPKPDADPILFRKQEYIQMSRFQDSPEEQFAKHFIVQWLASNPMPDKPK